MLLYFVEDLATDLEGLFGTMIDGPRRETGARAEEYNERGAGGIKRCCPDGSQGHGATGDGFLSPAHVDLVMLEKAGVRLKGGYLLVGNVMGGEYIISNLEGLVMWIENGQESLSTLSDK